MTVPVFRTVPVVVTDSHGQQVRRKAGREEGEREISFSCTIVNDELVYSTFELHSIQLQWESVHFSCCTIAFCSTLPRDDLAYIAKYIPPTNKILYME